LKRVGATAVTDTKTHRQKTITNRCCRARQ